ncbi:hypothetical protein GGF43_006675, partial [Coemansia sp. RSA 2618]
YLTFFVVVTLALILVTVYVSVQCYRNFGIGLKEAIADYDARKAQLKANRAMRNDNSDNNADDESRYEYTDVHERFVLD